MYSIKLKQHWYSFNKFLGNMNTKLLLLFNIIIPNSHYNDTCIINNIINSNFK